MKEQLVVLTKIKDDEKTNYLGTNVPVLDRPLPDRLTPPHSFGSRRRFLQEGYSYIKMTCVKE